MLLNGQPHYKGPSVWVGARPGTLSASRVIILYATDGTAVGGNTICSSLLSTQVCISRKLLYILLMIVTTTCLMSIVFVQ